MINLRKQFSDAYAKATPSSQARFLAKLLSHLTTAGRTTYLVGHGVSDGDLLRSFNEAHNRLASQLSHLLDREARRYPDDVFANIIIDNLVNVRFDEGKIANLLRELMRSSGIEFEEPHTNFH
jgi:hypothetical protein